MPETSQQTAVRPDCLGLESAMQVADECVAADQSIILYNAGWITYEGAKVVMEEIATKYCRPVSVYCVQSRLLCGFVPAD